MGKSVTVGDGDHRALEIHQPASLERAQRAGDGFPRGADEFADLFVSHRETKAPAAALRCLPVVAPIKQQTGKLFGRCGREPYGSQLVACPGNAAAQFFNDGLVSFGVTSEKVEKVTSSDVRDLRRVEGFRGHVVRAARESVGDVEDLALARAGLA